MKRAVALLLLAVVAAFGAVPARAAESGAVILMYHRFGEDAYPSTNIRLEQFEEHLRYLRDGNFNIVPLPDVIAAFENGEALPDRTVAITIDDAFRSIYDEAWPRLRAADIPFTVFVATDPVDQGHSNYMTWDQLRELHAAGVTIGNHTIGHLHLVDQDPDAVRREVDEAQARFEEELGFKPALFAYPFGETSEAIAQEVREQGFRAALGQHSAVAFAGHDRFYLPRFALNENYGGMERFELIANALPLPVADLSPADPTLAQDNPPAFGFTVDAALGDTGSLNCFAFGQGGGIDASLQRLGASRIEVRLAGPFPPGRARINCTMPASDGRWRWFGMQYYVPEPQ